MKTHVFTTVLLVFLTALSQAAVAQSRTHATLLSLYDRSDAVMIGRYDKREEFGSNRVGDGFTVVSLKTTFDISTVLKGDPQKSNEAKLEAIQMAWHEEFLDRTQG